MNKQLVWFLFTGLLSLLPIGVKFIIQTILSQPFHWEDFFKSGELFAITSVVCIASFGDVLFNKKEEINRDGQAWSILILVFVAIFSSVFYAIDTVILNNLPLDNLGDQFQLNILFIAIAQVFLYMLALITGTLSRNFAI